MLPEQESVAIGCTVCGRTDIGRKRADNQDNLLIADLTTVADQTGYTLYGDTAAGSPAADLAVGAGGLVMLVADGMGGAAGGAVASALAVSHVYHDLIGSTYTDMTIDRFAFRLRETLELANARIHEVASQDAAMRGMGTTATLAGAIGDTVLFAQVGDSRAYVVREGVATQVTRDQSLVQEMVEAGTLTEEQAELSAHRNTILQALGAAPRVNVVVSIHRLRRDDVVLLCSDGLTRVVQPREIAAAVLSAPDVATLCEGLVACANERGAPDNVTVIAARFHGSSLPAAAGEPVTRTVLELPAVA